MLNNIQDIINKKRYEINILFSIQLIDKILQ